MITRYDQSRNLDLKMTINKEDRRRLSKLISKLRIIAEPIGPLHGTWDVIIDIECLLKGQPTILKMSIDEWIAYGESCLKK